jgi:hypothetical protein
MIEQWNKDVKESDLPFDLERAKAGNAVEWLNRNGIWEEVLSFSLFDNNGLYIVVTHDFMSHSGVIVENLRMKYPNNGTK